MVKMMNSETLLTDDHSKPRRGRGVRPCLAICGVIMSVVALAAAGLHAARSTHSLELPTCTHPIYCRGMLLKAVQLGNVFPDCKTFVDMSMISRPEDVLSAFHQRFDDPSQATTQQLTDFVNEYFLPAGSELYTVTPQDFSTNPAFLNGIADPRLRQFAKAVHGKWTNLVRSYNFSSTCGPECHSSLALPFPFVVPGGRFREFYYWDTYWILKGLIVSDMLDTALHVVLNLLSLVRDYGFVPNGARIYYTDRSQPPLLTQMIEELYRATNNQTLLADALPVLMHEHAFWMRTHSVNIKPPDGGESVELNRYNVFTSEPRPESYREDLATAATSKRPSAEVFSDLAAGAETGWDYSSRWMLADEDLSSIDTRHVVPVDLNAIMLKNEILLSQWLLQTGDGAGARRMNESANTRLAAMRRVLWNATANSFYDYNEGTSSHNAHWYPSNISPLWVDLVANSLTPVERDAVVQSISTHVLAGGVPASMRVTGQQWDFPNAWPPEQWLALEALSKLNATVDGGITDASLTHSKLVQLWVETNLCGFEYVNPITNQTGVMFEKYNATRVGVPGAGGEYTVQEGFGWTNGVILDLLSRNGAWLSASAWVCA